MSEQAKQPEAPAGTAPEEKAALSTGKRNALLRYMAILFGVAFLLVLLSFLIQMRDSRDTISDLHKSNASALENALQLQEENQALAASNLELQSQLEQARRDAETAAADSTAAREQLDSLETQVDTLQTRLSETESAAAQDTENARLAGELLAAAQAAWDSGDSTVLDACLHALEPLQDSLSPAGQTRYAQLQTPPPPAEDPALPTNTN